MQTLVYQINIVPKWQIKGYENYFVSDKNKVHNLKTGRELKMQLKVYTKGYYLNSKFISLCVLRGLLVKIKTEKPPF